MQIKNDSPWSNSWASAEHKISSTEVNKHLNVAFRERMASTQQSAYLKAVGKVC